MKFFSKLHRYEYDNTPVYIDAAVPDWFVPSTACDQLLICLQQEQEKEAAIKLFCAQRHIAYDRAEIFYDKLELMLSSRHVKPYEGRSRYLQCGPLKELWFHVTDNCNLSCRHCLFAASPARQAAIERDTLYNAINEATDVGCRLFYFTGGEPFVYPDFVDVLTHVLEQNTDTHAVVLTNGLLLKKQLTKLQNLDNRRLHLQVSLDGLEKTHDSLRGTGSFARLKENINKTVAGGIPLTVSIAVNRTNAGQLPDICREAAMMGAGGIHLMFHFIRGKGNQQQYIDPEQLLPGILEAKEVCREYGLTIDNLEGLKSQVFTLPGTRHDLSNTAWESMAIGPNGTIYPSPALVGINELVCGNINKGLGRVFKESTVLQQIRKSSIVDDHDSCNRPLALLTGGGDLDHSWVNGNTFVGHDPYVPLYEQLMLSLIAEQAASYPDQGVFRLRMGDVRYDCPQEDAAEVVLTHCNCVISLSSGDGGHSSVRQFYGTAAKTTNTDIQNPQAPAGSLDTFIPQPAKDRSYGCGSPIKDAVPLKGETVIDLGSGSGVECFLAARAVGSTGRIIGIDMTDDMLALANESRKKVINEFGYDNIEFRKGFLENIPVDDESADVIVSNCVINLSPDKRKTYLEIMRVLKPGGRLVVADIVTDVPVSPAIGHSRRLRGECLGGAMQQGNLVQMLEDCGFINIRLHKRYPYRQVLDNSFYSLTYEARKAVSYKEESSVRVVYRGPHRSLVTESGFVLQRGHSATIPEHETIALNDSVFVLDDKGAVTNINQEPCCCDVAPEKKGREKKKRAVPIRRHNSGCMVCGQELIYHKEAGELVCHFCGKIELSNSECRQGHFICDGCHQQEAIEIIRHICLQSREKDLMQLLLTIRSHPSVPMHGPEHHAMIPGVILAVLRNCGSKVNNEDILAGIARGSKVPGGACGFWGSCGAAIGAGIAASLLLDATPLTPHPRQQAQAFTADILGKIAEIKGGRCCQRETWIALKRSAELSEKYFAVSLSANAPLHCNQYQTNKECIRRRCPLWEARVKKTDSFILPLTMAR